MNSEKEWDVRVGMRPRSRPNSVNYAIRGYLALWATLAAIGLIATFGSAAEAAGKCALVAEDLVLVDGLTDDWPGVGLAASQVKSGNVSTSCAYDSKRLYWRIVVPDDKIIRHKRPGPKEDSVKIQIGKGRAVTAAPGTRGFPPRVTGRPKWMEVADSRIPGGFVVELSMPLKRIPGWSRNLAGVSISYTVRDADGSGAAKTRSSRTRYHFSEADALLTSFLRAAGTSKRSIRLDVLRDVNLGKGLDRVVWAGTVIGVLTDKYIFMKLPVAEALDVVAVKVVNFSGTGRSQILAHYKQHGNGTRELVSVWNVDGSSRFQKLISVEVAKERDGQRIENSWALVRAGTTRAKARTAKRGYDLVIEATIAVGFNAQNYREMRASDADAILLPWSSELNRVYFFDGDELGGNEAMDPKVFTKRAKLRAKKTKQRR